MVNNTNRQSMTTKRAFLDTSIIARVSADVSFAQKTVSYLNQNEFTVILSTMVLVELYRKPGKRWDTIAQFLSCVPFCIPKNPDGILDAEVDAYPKDVTLPINL